jgi:hypothetical protein
MEWIVREEWRRKINLWAQNDVKTILCTKINVSFYSSVVSCYHGMAYPLGLRMASRPLEMEVSY